MQTSVEVFLEQIIDNVAFFECNQEDKIAEDKNNYTVLKVIVSKEKINTLKIGYYYELRLSKSMTPYKIYEDNNDEWDFYFYPYDVQYINLEIKIEETFRKRKLVVETYRKTYLLSSFFSDIFFYKPDENIWMHKIACIKSTIKKIIDGNYNPEEISTESSNTNTGERDEKIFAKLINIINENKNFDVIREAMRYAEMPKDLNSSFVKLKNIKGIGDFYASLILHAVYPCKAMIYNENCYRFFSDCSLLKGNEINNEYDIYSKIIYNRINKDMFSDSKEEFLANTSRCLYFFDYVEFLRQKL